MLQIDLSCPVELLRYTLPKSEADVCVFVMNNVSEQTVSSVDLLLSCFDCEEKEVFRQTECFQDLNAESKQSFEVTIRPLEWHDVSRVSLQVTKVLYENGELWNTEKAILTNYESNALSNGRSLDHLRFVAGEDAVGYPYGNSDLWVCVCGRPNHPDSESCVRCGRDRDFVFANFQQSQIEQMIEQNEQRLRSDSRKALESNNVKQQNRERAFSAKKRKRKSALKLSLFGILAAAVVAVILIWGIPELKYYTAEDLLNNQKYDEAYIQFTALENYKDSQERALECIRQKADACFQQGTEEGYTEACALYESLNGQLDGDTLALESTYALAELYASEQSYEHAAELYQQLGDYRDSADKRNEVIYQQACAMIEAKSFNAARILLKDLPQSSQVIEKLQVCAYETGKKKLEESEWQEAIQEFFALGEYLDAPELYKQAEYALAQDMELSGDDSQAMEHYLLAADYQNAAVLAQGCAYRLACQAAEENDWERSLELFYQAGDYEDSASRITECIYQLADEQLQQGNTEAALTALASIPEETKTEKILELEKKCNYDLATAALEENELETAEELFEEAGEYQDSKKQLRSVRYQLALQDYKAGEYARALSRYELLGSYKTTEADAKACRYQLGLNALEIGDFETAMTYFSELGGYKSSKTKLKEAQYQQALALSEAGQTEEAQQILKQLNTDEANSRLDEIYLEEGKALLAEEKPEEAMDVFQQIHDQEIANLYIASCRYFIAERFEQQGDLLSAGENYFSAGSYEDAKEKSNACFEKLYGDAPEKARNAANDGDYHEVVKILYGFSFTENSYTCADLSQLYQEALEACGDSLYKSGKPYEALAYYQALMVLNEKTASEKLNRRAYLMIGKWTNSTGSVAEFRIDGTCTLPEGEFCFQINNFSLNIGSSPDTVTLAYRINTVTVSEMSMSDVREVRTVDYHYLRDGEWTLPQVDLPESKSDTTLEAVSDDTSAE